MDALTFHIITFGCQMNVRDSQWLAGALMARGFSEAPLARARVVIINTCSVREKPEQKVMSALGRVRQESRGNPDVLVAVTGCVAQQLGATLFERSEQVRLVAGSDGIAQAPAAIRHLLAAPAERLTLCDFTPRYEERETGVETARGPCALVTIMQGCDNFCAYCIVPFTRGRQKSRVADAILAECGRQLSAGAREITLLGQNVNAWGKDAAGRHAASGADDAGFARLLASVAALPGLERLRYVTPHPRDMTDADIAAFADIPQLCPRLHLPLQAGSDTVLRRMRRRYDRRAYLDLVRRLRDARPEIALSTDLIVGFPGESEADFQATLDMMEECNFMSSFSFCYSDRPGAAAARFADKIAPQVQLERLQRLQQLQEQLGSRWLQSRVGKTTRVLVEARSPRPNPAASETPPASQPSQIPPPLEPWQGRDPAGAVVHVPLKAGLDHTGELVTVTIAEAKRHSLVARLAEDGAGMPR